ncbi:hypothetical protein [Paramagnetospirillum marisnigri]|nr:hypothetical protein [Paramagnetospirillum marisnigri]
MPEIIRRSPMPPTKLSQQDYTSAVANHLKTFEGAVPRIYTDDYGIPTMGSGVALAVRNGSGRFILRDLSAIGGEISGDLTKPYRFAPAETKLLNDTVGKLNDPKLDPDAKKREAQKLIPEYRPGAETADKNKFGFSLSDERIAKQAETAWSEHRERAFDTVRQQADKRGWSKEQTDAYIESLKGTRQEIALTSMAFNGVPAPKATGAMLDNDPATMRKEILYDSNADESRGIATRRRAEADLATGSPSGWKPEEQAKWKAVENSTEAKAYRKAYPKAFEQGQPSPDTKDPMSTDSLIERLKANPLPRFEGQPAPWPTASQWPQPKDGGADGADEGDGGGGPGPQDAPMGQTDPEDFTRSFGSGLGLL